MSTSVVNSTHHIAGVISHANTVRTDETRKKAADWDKQIIELNAKAIDAGMVVTLRSVLFESGKSELKRGSASTLGKLASFLHEHQDCNAVIEGYTNNVGSEAFNFCLSMCRANSVKLYLINEGVAPNRLAAAGNGESFPIASNDCASGRQLNCRVEVVISNLPVSIKQANKTNQF